MLWKLQDFLLFDTKLLRLLFTSLPKISRQTQLNHSSLALIWWETFWADFIICILQQKTNDLNKILLFTSFRHLYSLSMPSSKFVFLWNCLLNWNWIIYVKNKFIMMYDFLIFQLGHGKVSHNNVHILYFC